VPIVKLEDVETGLFMDISFNAVEGLHTIKLIQKFQIEFPELKFLVLVLKAFLKSRGLNQTHTGGISSYLLTILTISYLQQYFQNKGQRTLLSEHLLNFFELYGLKMNYKDVGISIRKGGSYFKRKERGWHRA
jgi:non-canonical poly(A) RNA polymerase PAPD5/7